MLRVMFIQGGGKTARHMAMACTKRRAVRGTREAGCKTSSTARVLKPGKRELHTKETILLVKRKEKVSIHGQMVPLLRVIGMTTRSRVSVFISGKMVASATVNGSITTCLDLEFIFTLMGSVTMVNSLKTRSRVLVFINGSTAEFTRGGGTRASNTALELTSNPLRIHLSMGFGKMGNDLNGMMSSREKKLSVENLTIAKNLLTQAIKVQQ